MRWAALFVVLLFAVEARAQTASCNGPFCNWATQNPDGAMPFCPADQGAVQIVKGVWTCKPPSVSTSKETSGGVWVIPGRQDAGGTSPPDICQYLQPAWDYCNGIQIPANAYGAGNPAVAVQSAFDTTLGQTRCPFIQVQATLWKETHTCTFQSNNSRTLGIGYQPTVIVDMTGSTIQAIPDFTTGGTTYQGTATVGTLPTCNAAIHGEWYKVTDAVRWTDPLTGGFATKTISNLAADVAGTYAWLGTDAAILQTTAAHGLSDGLTTTNHRTGFGDNIEITNATPSTWNGLWNVQFIVDSTHAVIKSVHAAPPSTASTTGSVQGAATAWCSADMTHAEWESGVPLLRWGGATDTGGWAEPIMGVIVRAPMFSKFNDQGSGSCGPAGCNFQTRMIVVDGGTNGNGGGIQNFEIENPILYGQFDDSRGSVLVDIGGAQFASGTAAYNCLNTTLRGGFQDGAGHVGGIFALVRCNNTVIDAPQRHSHGGTVVVGADISGQSNPLGVSIISPNYEGEDDGPAFAFLSGTISVIAGNVTGDVNGPRCANGQWDRGFLGVVGATQSATVKAGFYGTSFYIQAANDLPYYILLGNTVLNVIGGEQYLGDPGNATACTGHVKAGSLFASHAQTVATVNLQGLSESAAGTAHPLVVDTSGGGTVSVSGGSSTGAASGTACETTASPPTGACVTAGFWGCAGAIDLSTGANVACTVTTDARQCSCY